MPKTILVADDDPTLVHILERALEDQGYRVVAAYDGAQALKKVEEARPDLIILDVQMPQIHGYSFLFQLRKIEGPHDIPIVVLTANKDMADIFAAEGVKEYLIKPCPPQELIAVIKKYI